MAVCFPDGRELCDNQTSEETYKCKNGDCIRKQTILDGVVNCADGSDEGHDFYVAFFSS